MNGGPGGGAVRLQVVDTITIDGVLSANGGNGINVNGYGGSGGSIWVESGRLAGSGTIAANGGFNSTKTWCTSGGGRIDISDTTNDFRGAIEVFGGAIGGSNHTVQRGLSGTLLLPAEHGSGWRAESLVISNRVHFGNGQVFGDVVVTNGGSLLLDANEGDDLFSFDTLTVFNGGEVIFAGDMEQINEAAGGTTDIPYGRSPTLNVNSLVMHEGGHIHADGTGFRQARGPGRGANANLGGGGYGGAGGGSDGETYGIVYGRDHEPMALGSGGGYGKNPEAGSGGGAVRVKVSGSAVVNGRISADGQKAHGKYGGGGAGGSIWLEADSLVGNGVISAAGGDYNSATTGAGGGGRIYLKYSDGEMFTGTIDVAGGLGPSSSWHGAAGGVIIQDAAAPNVPPDMPELLYPAEGERLHAPYLQLSAYDDDDDLLRFKVEVASDSGFANIVRTIDQNMSQALWRGQMESGHTAYSGGQIATVIIAPPLAPDTTYYWRAYAIDYDGSGQWGDVSDIYSFSTFATAANWWVCEPNELVGDRKWENPDNWSTQNVPQPGEAVRFGGLFFDVPCVASIVSNDLHSLTIESAWGSTLTMASNAVAGTAMEWSFSNDITLENGTIEFYNDTSAIGGGSAESPHGCGYRIMADNMRISASAVLHADSRGFPAQQGPGKGIAGTSDDRGNGAGHGGFGGFGEKSPGAATRGVIYGSTNFPTALGSGGTSGTYSPPGGGAIWLELRGDLNLNGRLSANAPDALRARAGGSSGGSLFVAANCINGNGIIAANGGNSGTSSAAGGGGGGRISLLFGQTAEQRRAIIAGEMERFELLAEQPTHFSGNISALGGVGQYSHPPNAAENGTIVFIRALPSPGTFIIIR